MFLPGEYWQKKAKLFCLKNDFCFMLFHFLSWEEGPSTYTTCTSPPHSVAWHLHLTSFYFLLNSSCCLHIFLCVGKTVGTDSVQSITHGGGGCTASLQEGTLSLSSTGTKTQRFKVQNVLPCQFGDLTDDDSKDVEIQE